MEPPGEPGTLGELQGPDSCIPSPRGKRRDGAIVWMLGGEYSDFSLRASEGAAFRGQWAATKLEGDALLVFDNGVNTGADDDETDFVRASRFATVSFDEASGEARAFLAFAAGCSIGCAIVRRSAR